MASSVSRSVPIIGHRRFRTLFAFSMAVLSVTGCGREGEASMDGEAAAVDASAGALDLERRMALADELRSIDAALMPIRSRAQEDEEIRSREEALLTKVEATMEEIDPGVLAARDRLEALRGEYMAAQEEGEDERRETLAAEVQEIQARIGEAQRAALEREDVARAVEEFRERLFDWMRAEDPAADSLLDRAEAITDAFERAPGPEGG